MVDAILRCIQHVGMFSNIAILTLFGIVLIILETFLPGWIAGIIGTLFVLIAASLFLIADDFAGWSQGERLAGSAAVLVVAALVLIAWLRWFGVSFVRKVFTLRAISPGTASTVPAVLGHTGVALTDLRPLGRAEIDGQHYDVRCHLGLAPAGAQLKVIGAEPGNLLVRIL